MTLVKNDTSLLKQQQNNKKGNIAVLQFTLLAVSNKKQTNNVLRKLVKKNFVI